MTTIKTALVSICIPFVHFLFFCLFHDGDDFSLSLSFPLRFSAQNLGFWVFLGRCESGSDWVGLLFFHVLLFDLCLVGILDIALFAFRINRNVHHSPYSTV